KCWWPYERRSSHQESPGGSAAGIANLACLFGARCGICVGSVDYCRSGSISDVLHALHQGPNGHSNQRPFRLQNRRGSVHHEPEPDDSRFRNWEPYRRLAYGRGDYAGPMGCWRKRRHTSRNRQRTLESSAIPRTDRCACASYGGGAPSVQHTGTIYCHHPDDPLPACRVRESPDSEVYCQSREYRAGGGNGGDPLLGLVVGRDGLTPRRTAHSLHQAGRGFASVLMSLVEHAGADATSDSALGSLRRNGFGTDNPLLAPPRGKGFYRAPTLGDRKLRGQCWVHIVFGRSASACPATVAKSVQI